MRIKLHWARLFNSSVFGLSKAMFPTICRPSIALAVVDWCVLMPVLRLRNFQLDHCLGSGPVPSVIGLVSTRRFWCVVQLRREVRWENAGAIKPT